MTPTAKSPIVFISYSHLDEAWKDQLIPHFNQLQMADVLRVWDDRQIKQGEDWYARIKHVLDETEYAVCLISANFLSSDFCINEEVEYLLQHRRKDGGRRLHILPVLISDCVWEAHAWLRRLQMFPRDGQNVEEHFAATPNKVFAAVARTVYDAISGESPFPESPPPAGTPPKKVDVSRLPETGELLFGRRESIKLLNDAWNDPATRIVAFKAWGGVGKSTLVRVWTEQMAEDNYRGADDVFAWSFYSQGTGDRVTSADQFIDAALRFFGDDDPTAGSPWDKGERLARLVAGRRTLLLLDGMEPLQDSGEHGQRGAIKDPALQTLLTSLARDNSGLCVISTREDVADLQDGRFAGAVIHHDLEQVDTTAGRALLRVRGIHGTDEQLEHAVTAFGCHALAINLLASYLNETANGQIAAADAIPDIDVPVEKGKHPRRVIEAWRQYLGESAEVQLLRILGLFDRPATSGELAAVTAEPPIPGLTDKLPTDTPVLDSPAVERLRQIGLIARASKHRPDILDCHPLIREHFEVKLASSGRQPTDSHSKQSTTKESVGLRLPLAKIPPSSFREAHRRLYEHLKQSAPVLPDNLNDMMPLYHAVAHGCKAGVTRHTYEEVFEVRIQRGRDAYSVHKLGAFGSDLAALSCFFERSWNHPSPALTSVDQGIALNNVGYRLMNLNRCKEAKQPLLVALKLGISEGNWKRAAMRALNLSDLHRVTGEIADALRFAAQGLELAERSGHYQVFAWTRLAAGLFLSGRSAESESTFKAAEAIQIQLRPQFPFLHAVSGFLYRETFLERALCAVQDLLRPDKGSAICLCQEVRRRVHLTFEWRKRSDWDQTRDYVFHRALDYLSLGRSFLVESLLCEPGESAARRNEAERSLNEAVSLMHKAGTQYYLPQVLLSRALLRRIQFESSSSADGRVDDYVPLANRDLSEAESIAERGSMLIWQIEGALERTRLALCRAKSDSQNSKSEIELAQQKLDEARTLVAKTKKPYEAHVPDWDDWEPPEYVGVFKQGEIVGYHCRNDEIERLQAAINSASGGR